MSTQRGVFPADVDPAGGSEAEVLTLVKGTRRGDERAFEQLYRIFRGRIYALCLRLSGDSTAADTLTCDVFVRAWSKIDTFKQQGPFGAWLRRLAVNVVFEERRREMRRRQFVTAESDRADGDQLGQGQAPPARTLERIDLEKAIAGLPDGARSVFVLHDIEGYRHREIAELTGTAVGTTKAQLHRARQLLRNVLER